MGAHAWLLLATVVTELVLILKWSKGQFAEPFPKHIKIGCAFGVSLLVAYPLMKVSYVVIDPNAISLIHGREVRHSQCQTLRATSSEGKCRKNKLDLPEKRPLTVYNASNTVLTFLFLSLLVFTAPLETLPQR